MVFALPGLLCLQKDLTRQLGYVLGANLPPMATYAVALRSPYGIGCPVSPRQDEEATEDVLGTSGREYVQMRSL